MISAVKDKFYVDDYLDSCDSEEEAEDKIRKMTLLQKTGGFDLVNWISNSPLIMEKFGTTSETIKPFNTEDDSVEIERVLGLLWDAKNDVFRYKLQFSKVPQAIIDGTVRPTKREFLKLLMPIYDPLGFLVNFIIRGRIINQKIWREDIEWDEMLRDDAYKQYLHWIEFLKGIEDVKVPRNYSSEMSSASSVELYTFCDASEEAFAAVCYLRIKSKKAINIAFVLAKAKVAPLKPLTIPKLELQAAVMASLST